MNVGFFQGEALPDPARLLQGCGKFMRHLTLTPGKATDADSLRRLIEAAYADIKDRVENGSRWNCPDCQGERRQPGMKSSRAYSDGPSGSEDATAAVDDKVLAGHIRAGVGAQKEDGALVLVPMRHTAHGNQLVEFLRELLGLARKHTAG